MILSHFYYEGDSVPVEERLECFLYERYEDIEAED
jgi:hypothetical protein